MAQMQFKLRMPEPLREAVEASAKRSGNSLNTEIVQRLERSVRQEQQFSDPELSRMTFNLAAHFTVAVQDENWRGDPIAYAKGATAVFAEVIRGVPDSPERKLAIEGMVGGLLTMLAQAKEQDK